MNLSTKVRDDVTKRCSGLEIDRVPAKLNEGTAIFVSVDANHVRRPVAVWVGRSAPGTSDFGLNAWWVDIEADLLVFDC